MPTAAARPTTAATMPTGTRRNRRGCAVARLLIGAATGQRRRLCVESWSATARTVEVYTVAALRPFRLNREGLQGDRRLGNRCRHHRHGSRRRRCRQERCATVAAVRLPVSAEKVLQDHGGAVRPFGLNREGLQRDRRRIRRCRQRRHAQQRRQRRQERGATVAAVALPVSAVKCYRATAAALRRSGYRLIDGLAIDADTIGAPHGGDRIAAQSSRLCGCPSLR